MTNIRTSIIAASAGIMAAAGGATASPVNIWDFNVFSRSTIGSAGSGYGSDFQGAAGSVGSAWFSNFGAKGLAGSSPTLSRAFYGGGDFTLAGSVPRDGVSVAGNVAMSNASITGPVNAGGNLTGTSGSITGAVTLGGTKTAGQSLSVNGVLTQHSAYVAPVDLANVSSQFLSISNYVAGLTPNALVTNQYGQLMINATSPLTVVNLNAALLASSWGVKISGSGTVVINLLGTAVSFGSKTWTYDSGATASTTLLNLNQATTFNLSGGNHALSILAPNAATTFTSGVVTGNLIVGSLAGSGQVNWGGTGGFGGNVGLVPAPGAAALGCIGALAYGVRRRR